MNRAIVILLILTLSLTPIVISMPQKEAKIYLISSLYNLEPKRMILVNDSLYVAGLALLSPLNETVFIAKIDLLNDSLQWLVLLKGLRVNYVYDIITLDNYVIICGDYVSTKEYLINGFIVFLSNQGKVVNSFSFPEPITCLSKFKNYIIACSINGKLIIFRVLANKIDFLGVYNVNITNHHRTVLRVFTSVNDTDGVYIIGDLIKEIKNKTFVCEYFILKIKPPNIVLLSKAINLAKVVQYIPCVAAIDKNRNLDLVGVTFKNILNIIYLKVSHNGSIIKAIYIKVKEQHPLIPFNIRSKNDKANLLLISPGGTIFLIFLNNYNIVRLLKVSFQGLTIRPLAMYQPHSSFLSENYFIVTSSCILSKFRIVPIVIKLPLNINFNTTTNVSSNFKLMFQILNKTENLEALPLVNCTYRNVRVSIERIFIKLKRIEASTIISIGKLVNYKLKECKIRIVGLNSKQFEYTVLQNSTLTLLPSRVGFSKFSTGWYHYIANNTRLAFTSWNFNNITITSPRLIITVNKTTTITPSYIIEYLIRIIAPYQVKERWVKNNTILMFSVINYGFIREYERYVYKVSPNERLVFTSWEVNGRNITRPIINVKVNSPLILKINYEKEYLVTIYDPFGRVLLRKWFKKGEHVFLSKYLPAWCNWFYSTNFSIQIAKPETIYLSFSAQGILTIIATLVIPLVIILIGLKRGK